MDASVLAATRAAIEAGFVDHVGRIFETLCGSLARGERPEIAAENFTKGMREGLAAREGALAIVDKVLAP